LQKASIQWHGIRLHQPDWSPESHSIALTARSLRGRFILHWMINAYWSELVFEIPNTQDLGAGGWKRWIDTSCEAPRDVCSWEEAPVITDSTISVAPRSMVVLFARTVGSKNQ
jgi:glycogen operon protein